MAENLHLIVVTMMAPSGDTGVQTHFTLMLEAALMAGVQGEIVTPHGTSSVLQKLPGAVTRLLRKVSIESSVRWFRWAACRRIRQRLAARIRAFGPDNVVVYAQDPISAKAALNLGRLRPSRVVMVVHYNVSEAYEYVLSGVGREQGRLYRSLLDIERRVLPCLDAIIFPSHFMRRQVFTRVPTLESSKTHVIPNFQKQSPAAADVVPDADILSIGTLEPRKNQIFLLKVLAHAKRLGHTYTLTMVGHGPSLNELQKQVDHLGIETQVKFLGRVDGAARLLPRHRVYAHAAIVENLPITLVEALAAGRPIFAPAVGGIPEVFVDGREGAYWDLDNEDTAAEKLIAVLEDSTLYRKLSRAAHERYEKAFSPAVLASQWLHAILARQGGNETSIAPTAQMSEIQLG